MRALREDADLTFHTMTYYFDIALCISPLVLLNAISTRKMEVSRHVLFQVNNLPSRPSWQLHSNYGILVVRR